MEVRCRPFCAFPRGQAWGLHLVRLLPRWLRAWLVMRNVPPHLGERAAKVVGEVAAVKATVAP